MFYTKFTEKIILPLSDVILGTSLWKTFNEWKIIEKKSSNELNEIQINALKKILKHTVKEVPYYKAQGIIYNKDVKKYLLEFPILTKEILKKTDLLSCSKENLIKSCSSGSTGIQSCVYMSENEKAITFAIQALWWYWSGYSFGNTVLQTGINTKRGIIKKFKDILLRFKYINAFSLNENDILKLLKKLKHSQKQHLVGYASSLYLIAKIAKKHNINDIKFESVMSLGDKMFDHYRKTIEEQFKTKVFDTYGCSEGLMMAGECEKGKYHIMSPHIYMEILDDYGFEVEPGEIGHVTITRLDAYAMPLIRYQLGDLAIKGNPTDICSCGRSFPLLGKVIGRETDLIQFPSGKFITVHSFTAIFEYFCEIKQFQIVELDDGIMIRYIKDYGFNNNTLNQLESKIREQVDSELNIVFKEENFIKPTASGKPCMVISKKKTLKRVR